MVLVFYYQLLFLTCLYCDSLLPLLDYLLNILVFVPGRNPVKTSLSRKINVLTLSAREEWICHLAELVPGTPVIPSGPLPALHHSSASPSVRGEGDHWMPEAHIITTSNIVNNHMNVCRQVHLLVLSISRQSFYLQI